MVKKRATCLVDWYRLPLLNEFSSRMEAIAHPSYILAIHIPIIWLSVVKCVHQDSSFTVLTT